MHSQLIKTGRSTESTPKYFMCSYKETAYLLDYANQEWDRLCKELLPLLPNISSVTFRAYVVDHVGSFSIAGDLIIGDRVVKSEDPVDLLFLSFHEYMLQKLLDERSASEL